MELVKQVLARKKQLRKTGEEIASLIGISRPHLAKILSPRSDIDTRASTLEALADALEAKWILVPKHQIPEVERLMSGKPVGPDDVPSSVRRMLG